MWSAWLVFHCVESHGLVVEFFVLRYYTSWLATWEKPVGVGPLSLGEPGPPQVALLCLLTMQLSGRNWPESSAFVLIRIRRLAILYKGVECILEVTKDVLRQDSDSKLLPTSLCSTLFFLRFRQRKAEQRELGHRLWKILISENIRCSRPSPLYDIPLCGALMWPVITPVGTCFLREKIRKEKKNLCSQCPKIM